MERALLQGGAMALFLVVGALHPRVRAQALVHRDLVLNLANGLLLFAFSATAVAWVAARSEVGLVDLALVGPEWLQFIVAAVLMDFTRYWVHRADHQVPWLWTFHRVHHSAEALDATTGLRMHLVDFVQLSAIPLVLFSVLIDISGAPWIVAAAIGVGVVFDAFQHANIRMDMTRPWNRAWNLLFNHPHFHSWHHTRDGALCDGNYSNTLIIWDRIFGTEVTQAESPAQFGLEGDQELDNTLTGWHLLRSRQESAAP